MARKGNLDFEAMIQRGENPRGQTNVAPEGDFGVPTGGFVNDRTGDGKQWNFGPNRDGDRFKPWSQPPTVEIPVAAKAISGKRKGR